jgi:hypothetical protein
MSPAWRARLAASEGPLVYLIALHSAIVGLMLLAFPAWAVPFAGWDGATPLFFPRQAGIFHFVVVIGYLGEWRRERNVRLLVATKAIAFAFLIGAWLDGESAWSVPFSGVADGLMGLVAALVHREASRSSASRAASSAASSVEAPISS